MVKPFASVFQWLDRDVLEPSRTSTMELSCENSERICSIVDVWLGSKYASAPQR